MPANFNIGDLVETIDDNLKGEIVQIENGIIKIRTEDDFDMFFNAKEIIKIPSTGLSLNDGDLHKALQQELKTYTKTTPKKEKKTQETKIDLHIHELIDDARHLSNFEILNIQLSKAKNQLEWAIQKQLKSVIFIHGVGQGVLKAELHTLFTRYDNLEFFDADYQTYGFGATQVLIY